MNILLRLHGFRCFLGLLGLLLAGSARPAAGQGPGAAYVHVAAGSDFTFAIQANGTLWAWGNNFFGQLGDGTTIVRTAPVAVAEPATAAPGSRWVRIFARGSGSRVFGLRSDQTLWQWGANQLRPVQEPLAASLPSGATLVDLATSTGHFLALYSDGSLLSWGDNRWGQLGQGVPAAAALPTPAPVVTPTTAAAGTRWTAIVAYGSYSFATRSDGTLWSWGYAGAQGSIPVLGHPVVFTGCFVPEQVLHPAGAAPGTGWVAVKPGYNHALGLRSDGTLWAWGHNSSGAMGVGFGVSHSAAPMQVPLPAGVAAGVGWQLIDAGADTSLGILTDGTLWAWGSNSHGQLGVNISNNSVPYPLQEYNQETWTQLELGIYHTVALSRGRVHVTGGGSIGQLGLGNGTSRMNFLVRVVGLPLAVADRSPTPRAAAAFPNPAAGGESVVVEEAARSTRAEFLNSQGQVVAVVSVRNARMNIPPLAPGLFLLRFYAGNRYLLSSKLHVR